ncbi:MAG: OmpH family outer membrane protein [Pseudomonadota bacterium]
MLKNLRLFAVLTVMAAVAITPLTAVAADAPLKIAVVNYNRVIDGSTAATKAKQKLAAKRDALRKELIAKEKDLRTKQQTLVKEKAKLKPEDFKVKVKDLEKEFISTNEKLNKQKAELDGAWLAADRDLREEMLKIIAKIAEAEKIDLVLSSDSVVIAAQKLDITAKVLADVNKTVSEISTSPAKKK